MSHIWGHHAIFDCKQCDYTLTKNPTYIKNFIKQMLLITHMKAYGEPQIEHIIVDDNQSINGYSAVQLMYTSSLVCHFLDNNGDAYIDFFSCKEFDIKLLKRCINKFFNPLQIRVRYLKRQA